MTIIDLPLIITAVLFFFLSWAYGEDEIIRLRRKIKEQSELIDNIESILDKHDMLTLNNRLYFGKYGPEYFPPDGKLLRWVIDNDPEYILWCLENIEWFEIDVNAEDALEWAMADIWED